MKPTFEFWLKLVDQHVEATLGLGREDLPDCCYLDWYNDGMSAKNAAARAIRHAKED